ncbi:DUF268 domain-containing protein [Polynucleobacter paneuropaeus]|nr:DUF268 domain-containing protein [Polynucleobacter paneuropaeus]QWD20106.1 DUF268 domain-containing protein [Polynucleobacter paneuropaeus]
MIKIVKKINWFLCAQLGIDLRLMWRSLKGFPRYFFDLYKFTAEYKGNIKLLPCLGDYNQEGGSTKSEYFWQDLFIAQRIFESNPEKHVDIGSRIDSFVAHVASYREIEIFDIRSINSKIPNVVFRRADLMDATSIKANYCDSLSCLHALEHFGLGRYGDPINANGYKYGISNMARLVKPGGTFYLSAPIGKERVEFNAHRIFCPKILRDEVIELGFDLQEFTWIDSKNILNQSLDIQVDMSMLEIQEYNLGIFIFKKRLFK